MLAKNVKVGDRIKCRVSDCEVAGVEKPDSCGYYIFRVSDVLKFTDNHVALVEYRNVVTSGYKTTRKTFYKFDCNCEVEKEI